MKKFMATVLACAIVVTAFMGLSLTASAEAAPIVFTAQSVTGVQAGDTITVDISVSENHYMVNGQVWVIYDPEVLEIQTVWEDEDNPYFEEINSKIFKSSYMWAFAVPTPGVAKMAFATSSSKGTTAGGVMFTLTFKVLENAKNSVISIEVPEMCSNDGVANGGEDFAVEPTFENGVVTIGNFGDVDADEKVDVADVVKLLEFVNNDAELTEEETKAADINQDGNVNFVDAVRLFYYVNGLI